MDKAERKRRLVKNKNYDDKKADILFLHNAHPRKFMFDLCAIGNALVDTLISTDDEFLKKNGIVKGAMTLVDEKAAMALYEAAGPSVELSSGGSAANTVAGAASLDVRCAFLGKVGKDSFGDVFTHDMHAQKIHFSTRPSAAVSTGRCIVLVTPDAQRSMSTYLGAAVEFGPDDVDPKIVQDSAMTYLEGYLFDKPQAQRAFYKAAALAHEAGRKTAITLSDPFCVERHRDVFFDLIERDIDLLFANEHEAQALYRTQDFHATVEAARAHAKVAVVTRSEKGAVVVAGENTHEVDAHTVFEVVDSTGAGDLFAAGFLYGLSRGKDLQECGRIGAIAAAEVISHYGSRPQRKLKDLL